MGTAPSHSLSRLSQLSKLSTSSTSSTPSEAAATDDERAQLDSVCSRLAGFLAGSEDVFLEAGRRLQMVQASAQRLVRTSAVSADGLEQKDPVGAVRAKLEQIGAHLDQSRTDTSADAAGLGRMITKVELLGRFERPYHGLASALRLIAIQTSIENTASDSKLDTVARDTRRLASEIEPKFGELLCRAARLDAEARGARERVVTFMAQQGKRAKVLVADTDEGLGALQAIAACSAELSETGRSTKDRVASRVSEVLFALQVHDSTRQVIEHVIEELRELQADPGEAREQWLAEVAELARLAARQLAGGRTRLALGLGQITASLFDLAGGVTVLAEKAGALASGNAGDLLHKVQLGIGASARLLREQDAEEKKLAEAVHGVGEALRDMATCIASIDKVGHEVKMLSLNAMVETCQVANGSQVFAALASEMTGLAGSVHQLNQVVGAALEEVSAEALRLDRTRVVSGGDEKSIADDFDLLVATLREWHRQLAADAQVLGEGSEGVVSAAQEVARLLDAQAQAAMALEALEQELERLAGAAALKAGPAATGVKSQRLLAAAARYTMESERAVHAAEAGHAPDAAAIPAGSVDSGVNSSVNSGVNSGVTGMGDNVELF